MSKTNKKGGSPKGGPAPISGQSEPGPKVTEIPPGQNVTVPEKATVLTWIRKDLEAAHYLLGIILQRHPEIVEEMADQVYDTIMRKENGAAIDHVAKDHSQTGLD